MLYCLPGSLSPFLAPMIGHWPDHIVRARSICLCKATFSDRYILRGISPTCEERLSKADTFLRSSPSAPVKSPERRTQKCSIMALPVAVTRVAYLLIPLLSLAFAAALFHETVLRSNSVREALAFLPPLLG